jgi:hypothetical protein
MDVCVGTWDDARNMVLDAIRHYHPATPALDLLQPRTMPFILRFSFSFMISMLSNLFHFMFLLCHLYS